MTNIQFDEILKTLEELKQNNYVNISGEHHQMFEKAKIYALEQISTNKNPTPIQNLMSCTQTASQKQIEQNRKIEADGFNLDEHFNKLSKEHNLHPIETTTSKIVDREHSPFIWMKNNTIDAPDELKYTQNILDTLRKKNEFLDTALKDKNITINILDDKSIDGKFKDDEYTKSNGKNVIININKSCFDENNKNILPMLIAHEFGHFIDVSSRPLGYTGGLKDKEEFFADSIGAKMTTNAGYENSITAFKENLNSKDNSLLKSRAKFLDERYPETKTEQKAEINSYRIAKLRGITTTEQPVIKPSKVDSNLLTKLTTNTIKK